LPEYGMTGNVQVRSAMGRSGLLRLRTSGNLIAATAREVFSPGRKRASQSGEKLGILSVENDTGESSNRIMTSVWERHQRIGHPPTQTILATQVHIMKLW
jgi:hypothetical protein